MGLACSTIITWRPGSRILDLQLTLHALAWASSQRSCLLDLTLAHITLTASWLKADSRFLHSSLPTHSVISPRCATHTLAVVSNGLLNFMAYYCSLNTFALFWWLSGAVPLGQPTKVGCSPLTHGLSLLKSVWSQILKWKMSISMCKCFLKWNVHSHSFSSLSVLLAFSPAQFPKPALIDSVYVTACPQHSFFHSDSHYPIFVNGNETPMFENMVSFPFPLDTKLVQRGCLSAALPAKGISQREDIRGLSIDKLLELREASQRSSPVPLSSLLCLPGWSHPLILISVTYWCLSNIYIELKTNVSVLCQSWS